MGKPRKSSKDGRTVYISSDGRVHSSRLNALAANAAVEAIKGIPACQDPDILRAPDKSDRSGRRGSK